MARPLLGKYRRINYIKYINTIIYLGLMWARG